jgi:formylglycine-generating enzyme required for sulfatase activity
VAWHVGNSGYTVHQVGTKEPNAFGIYDMSGNVSEWVSDGYESYSSVKQNNPTGATSGTPIRMIRGGSWGDNDSKVRAAARDMDTGFRSNTRGGRLIFPGFPYRKPSSGWLGQELTTTGGGVRPR